MASLLTDPPVDASQRPRARDPRDAGQRFRRALLLMVMTLLVPGSAQLVMGRRRTGRVALRIWLGLVVTGLLLLGLGLVFDTLVWRLLTSDFVLSVARVLLMALAVGWAFLVVDAWRLGDPMSLRRKQRLAMVGVNGVLCFSVAGSLLFASHLVTVNKDLMGGLFADGTAVGAHDGRFNVLLLGGDSGADRWGLRPDSIQVASIDADTGKTVLLGLPRNMLNFPFPEGSVMDAQFPDGYDCGAECELNSLATWAYDHPDLFPGSEDPGVDATIQGVEGITGLDINYYAMVNMRGFEKLVDAVGGIELNVREDIPIGGGAAGQTGTVEAGRRTLDGYEALWFARSRMSSDDYSRMARQKCVIDAMVRQLDPQTVLLNFQDIAEASKALVSTDLPRGEVGKFIDLALKARSHPIRTVSFVPPLVSTSNPDIDLIHDKVQTVIERSEGKGASSGKAAPAKPAPAPKQAATTGGSIGSLKAGYGANQADDLSAVC